MEKKPSGQEHDFNRHGRGCAPRDLAEQGEGKACKDIDPGRPTQAQNESPRLHHVGGVGRIAEKLERKIGLDRGADVGKAVFVKGPAAVRKLLPAQIFGQTFPDTPIDLPAQKALKHDVFRWYGGVRFKVKDPIPFGVLNGEEKVPGPADGLPQMGHTEQRCPRPAGFHGLRMKMGFLFAYVLPNLVFFSLYPLNVPHSFHCHNLITSFLKS